MSYAGDEDAPGFPSNDVQLVLEGVDAALQFVQRHAVRRYMQDALTIGAAPVSAMDTHVA